MMIRRSAAGPTSRCPARYTHLIWKIPVEIQFGEWPCGFCIHPHDRGAVIFTQHPRHGVVGEMVATLVHEVLHQAHPRKNEAWIEAKMKRLYKNDRFVREVYARLCHCMLRELRTLTPDRAAIYDRRGTP